MQHSDAIDCQEAAHSTTALGGGGGRCSLEANYIFFASSSVSGISNLGTFQNWEKRSVWNPEDSMEIGQFWASRPAAMAINAKPF